MTRVNSDQISVFELEGISSHEVPAAPVGLRAEGLLKILGYYDSMGRTNVHETHVRLGKVAAEVFAKTFGVKELIAADFDEAAAAQMANDFYFGSNNTGYNPAKKSFLQSYIGKANKSTRKEFQQTVGSEITTFPAEAATYTAQQPAEPTARRVLDKDKVILPRHAQVVQAAGYEGLEPEGRVTLGRLISLAGDGIDEPWLHEEPSIPLIKAGLYIPPQDRRFRRAELLVRVGVDFESSAPGNVGVVFPPEEFKTVARSPRDLVRHMQAVTRRANETNEDRDDVSERTGRSAGHVLTQKIAAMTALSGTLEGHREFLRKMHKELDSSWIAHYMSKNLEKHRVRIDEMIHDTADVATVNLNYGSDGIARLHNGIKKKLYGGNRTHAEISEQWQAYIQLVGRYIGMRLIKIGASVQFCEKELSAYQPYLDRKQKAA